ncbi:MAG: adenylyl-sulfate kinase [candidate division Zixibacteria bacterium]|nr:adenylyl-sulfate kinase [candidate division Zixibacteria bacterium]
MQKGFTIWFTGLSGSGKSTVSKLVAKKIREEYQRNVEVLDGDVVRQNLSKGLGFSKEDRDTNILRIAFVAMLLTRNGVVAITAAISPYRDIRQKARESIGNFIEVHVNCPLEICEQRDVKGLYKKARAGQIKLFTGIDDPYEAPDEPEVVIYTDRESPEDSANKIINKIKELGYFS